ncbi:MAG: DUF5709 domain-containing protein [Cellulomonadaceae bacterium]|jgi:hypothetical protein|nr:DUF5709 domain-containing protein [Cellulomonadaceae bacterium]
MYDDDDPVTAEDQFDDAAESPSNQPNNSDMLLDDDDPADWLDAGYSPPDYEPNTYGKKSSDDFAGETIDDYLSAENPEVWDQDYVVKNERRAGRLVDTAGGDFIDDGDGVTDAFAIDVGIDGAGASAEEAAVHITEAP